jgi:cobalamin biosynthesis Mg chelatase CobN
LTSPSDLEEPLVLVVGAELVDGLVHGDGIVDLPQLQVDLLLELGHVLALDPGEGDVTDERTLGDDERDPDASLEVLHLGLHVVEEAQGKDGPDVLGKPGRHERRPDPGP